MSKKSQAQNPDGENDISLLKEYFIKTYQATESGLDPDIIFMSTAEVFRSFYNLYPSSYLSAEVIASWLLTGGFKIVDMGSLRFEWMLKKTTNN